MQKIKSIVGALPSWLKLLMKIAVTVVCLWYVSRKIDWALTWILLQQSNKWWLLAATFLVAASKVVSAFRLNIYFKNIAIDLKTGSSLKLYWLGMFYNLFLPGGIGGDAYKVILLNRKYKEVPAKKIAAAVLLDRISGVVALGLLAVLFFWLIYQSNSYSWWLIAAVLPGLVIYYWGIKKIFPSFLPGFYSTFFLGLAVQLLQVLCVLCIMQSIGISGHFKEFQLLFLLSSIVAILPFTIGGLGAREVVFLWGATQFALDPHQAVYISILFYLIHLLVSLVGLRWAYRSPLA
ncbi:MAG: lysylphosphatidylglycerol synthase transmembrane domain-containing protein [Bacteroidota bacterium]